MHQEMLSLSNSHVRCHSNWALHTVECWHNERSLIRGRMSRCDVQCKDKAVCRYVVSFVMPSKYKTKDDLPKPRNPNLSLREVESHEVAAIAWR